jgi:Uma2 family endonuclease
MARPQQESPISEEEYLKMEDSSEFKHEYAAGQIFDMTGATWNHNRISLNTGRHLDTLLEKTDCAAAVSDQRLKIEATRSYRFPDAMVICGEPAFVDDREDIVSNPVVLVEVLSPSTHLIDRNEKFVEYRQIPSLQEYILVSQDEVRVERFLRQESGDWLYSEVRGLDGVLDLPSIGCKLALAEVYRKVRFGAGDADAAPEGEG